MNALMCTCAHHRNMHVGPHEKNAYRQCTRGYPEGCECKEFTPADPFAYRLYTELERVTYASDLGTTVYSHRMTPWIAEVAEVIIEEVMKRLTEEGYWDHRDTGS